MGDGSNPRTVQVLSQDYMHQNGSRDHPNGFPSDPKLTDRNTNAMENKNDRD